MCALGKSVHAFLPRALQGSLSVLYSGCAGCVIFCSWMPSYRLSLSCVGTCSFCGVLPLTICENATFAGERGSPLDAGFSPPCLCRGGCHIVTIQFGMRYSSLSSSTINIHRASRGRRLTKRNNHKYGEHLLTFLSPYE